MESGEIMKYSDQMPQNIIIMQLEHRWEALFQCINWRLYRRQQLNRMQKGLRMENVQYFLSVYASTVTFAFLIMSTKLWFRRIRTRKRKIVEECPSPNRLTLPFGRGPLFFERDRIRLLQWRSIQVRLDALQLWFATSRPTTNFRL
jgi:hypothetical protein